MMFRDARKEQFGWRNEIAPEDHPQMKDAQICQ